MASSLADQRKRLVAPMAGKPLGLVNPGPNIGPTVQPKPMTGQQPMIQPPMPQLPGTMTRQLPGGLIQPPVPQQPGLPAPNINVRPNINLQPNLPTPGLQPPQEETGPLTTFGPGNDLRDQQINPLASNRLTGTQGMVDAAGRALSGGPSLSDAAATEFRTLLDRNADQRTRGIQETGRGAARLGRVGSGMVTTDLGNLEERLRISEDQAAAGLSADVARGEAGNRRANLAAIMGLEGQQFGQEAGQRGELRTERGYQADTAQNALQNRVQQRLLEESLLNSGYNRELAGADLGLRGAESYSNDAAQSGDATQALLTELARAQAAKRRGTRTVGQPASDAGYDSGYS